MLNKNSILAALFWALITTTTFLLLVEVKPVPQTWPKDKLEHAIVFALLSYLGIKAYSTKAYSKYALTICLALAIFGGLMELLQSQLTLTRSGSVADWLADIVGITLGLFALNLHKNPLQAHE